MRHAPAEPTAVESLRAERASLRSEAGSTLPHASGQGRLGRPHPGMARRPCGAARRAVDGHALAVRASRMYERIVDVPRLMATVPEDGSGHPVLNEMAQALSDRYGRPLLDISLAAYRDGHDSVAFHGDRLGVRRADAIVAIVSLGFARRFLLRRAGGAAPRARSTSAAAICSSWAARASSPGSTRCPRLLTPDCASASSSVRALPTPRCSARSVHLLSPSGYVLPVSDQEP